MREVKKSSESYVRPKEAAQILGVSVRTIWNWTNQRREEGFPLPIQISKRITVFPRSEIVAFAESKKIG